MIRSIPVVALALGLVWLLPTPAQAGGPVERRGDCVGGQGEWRLVVQREGPSTLRGLRGHGLLLNDRTYCETGDRRGRVERPLLFSFGWEIFSQTSSALVVCDRYDRRASAVT